MTEGFETIVVGVDDSAGARTALSWSARLAAATGSRLRVVLVYEFTIAWIDAYSAEIPAWRERAREAAQESLDRVLADALDAEPEVALEAEVVEGDPADVLHDESTRASMVVVGTRGRGGFTGLLLGSVSQRVAQHAACPVTIVPGSA